jgi:hypothetical protein
VTYRAGECLFNDCVIIVVIIIIIIIVIIVTIIVVVIIIVIIIVIVLIMIVIMIVSSMILALFGYMIHDCTALIVVALVITYATHKRMIVRLCHSFE